MTKKEREEHKTKLHPGFEFILATKFFNTYAKEVKSYKMKMKHGGFTEADRRAIAYGLTQLSKQLMEPLK